MRASSRLLGFFFVAGAMLVLAGGGRAMAGTVSGWGKLGTYGSHYDRATVQTVNVRVVEMIKVGYGDTRGGRGCYALALRAEDEQGMTRMIYLGPGSYLARCGCDVAPGDRLAVTGSAVEIEGRQLVLAGLLVKDGRTVRIRTDEGRHL